MSPEEERKLGEVVLEASRKLDRRLVILSFTQQGQFDGAVTNLTHESLGLMMAVAMGLQQIATDARSKQQGSFIAGEYGAFVRQVLESLLDAVLVEGEHSFTAFRSPEGKLISICCNDDELMKQSKSVAEAANEFIKGM